MAVVKIVSVDWSREIPSANMMTIVRAGRPGDPQRQGVQLRGQRGLQGGRRLQHPGDAADLGAVSRPGDDHHTAPVRDRGVHERHVRLIPHAGLLVGDRLGALGRGDALAGQPGLVDLQRRGLDDPPVGADVVARRQEHDVADHHLVGIDLDLRAVTADPGGRLEHRLQRVHGALRLALLAHPPERVHRRDRQDGEARGDLSDQDRGDGRHDEDDLHVAPVLGQELLPTRHRRLGRQARWARSSAAAPRLSPRTDPGRDRHRAASQRPPAPARTRPSLTKRPGCMSTFSVMARRARIRTVSGCSAATTPVRRTHRGSAAWASSHPSAPGARTGSDRAGG